MIDLSLLCEVTPSEDGSCVVIGSGAKWMDVSKTLDQMGLAVVEGRNSAVGVGGLTLGGESRPLKCPYNLFSSSDFKLIHIDLYRSFNPVSVSKLTKWCC